MCPWNVLDEVGPEQGGLGWLGAYWRAVSGVSFEQQHMAFALGQTTT